MKLNTKYVRQFLFLLITALGLPAAAALTKDAPSDCSGGSVCAIVCAKGPDVDVYFADFASIQGNGQVHRRIIERLGTSPDEQIREHALQLSEADRYSSDLFDGAMEHVKRTTEFDDATTLTAKGNCEYQTLADYSPYKHAFIVDQKLYEKLNSTDRAGLWTRLAFSHLAGETDGAALSPKIPKLVTQIYYGSEEDHDRVKLFKTSPLTKTEKLENIRELLKSVVPQPADENTEGENS